MTDLPKNTDLPSYCQAVAAAAKEASYQLALLDTEAKNRWLKHPPSNCLRAATAIWKPTKKISRQLRVMD